MKERSFASTEKGASGGNSAKEGRGPRQEREKSGRWSLSRRGRRKHKQGKEVAALEGEDPFAGVEKRGGGKKGREN